MTFIMPQRAQTKKLFKIEYCFNVDCDFVVVVLVDLLTNCSQVADKVLDSSDEMLRTWADLPLVTAVCEAMKQMHMR